MNYRCASCETSKPISEWYTRKGGKRGPYCKVCHYAEARSARLRTLFDITADEYEIALSFQGGVCAICMKPPKVKRLSVDHNHVTGQVRGLLCWNCNTALGKFDDDLEHLLRAAEYSTNPPITHALGREVFGRKGRTTNKMRRKRKKRVSRSA